MDMTIDVGLLETLLTALLILFAGYAINSRVLILQNNNIPEPVVGGIVFSLLSAVVYSQFNISINFDMAIKTPLMIMFFTSVGLGASLKLLLKGGPKVLLFLAVASLYLILQNAIGVSMAMATDLNPLFGLLAGSITLSGGHGTGATYSQLLQDSHNLQGVLEVAMAAATCGLVLGGLIGGPVSRRLITRYRLEPSERPDRDHDMITYNPDDQDLVTPKRMMETLLVLVVCMSSGAWAFEWLKAHSIPVPSFIVPLVIGIFITNGVELSGVYKISKACVDLWGTMALSIFLALALMSLRIWELANLAGPMLFIILIQTMVLAAFAYLVTFRIMGKNYDAAIMAGGHCGFGLGATPTAVANMESLVSKFGPSPQAFLVVPMVGAFFIDITNALIIQTYLSIPAIH